MPPLAPKRPPSPAKASKQSNSQPTQRHRKSSLEKSPPRMAMSPASCGVSFPARPAVSVARPRGGAGPVAVRAGAEGAGGKWWAPLLGWSGRADYLEPVPARDDAAARRQFVGGLTEEKARELRSRMAETECFHDAMYHSAIASRLARSA